MKHIHSAFRKDIFHLTQIVNTSPGEWKQSIKRNGQIDRNTTDKKSLSMKHIHSAFRKDIFEPPLTESKILAYSF